MVNPSNKNILVVLWCYGNCQIQIRHGTNSTIGYWIVLLRNQHLGYRRCNSSRTSDACFKGLYFVIKSFFSRNGNGNIQLQNSTYRNCTIIIMFYKIIQNYIVYGTRRWDTILDGRTCEIERSEWSFFMHELRCNMNTYSVWWSLWFNVSLNHLYIEEWNSIPVVNVFIR